MNISEVEYNYIRKQLLLINTICGKESTSDVLKIENIKAISQIVIDDLELMKEKPDDS